MGILYHNFEMEKYGFRHLKGIVGGASRPVSSDSRANSRQRSFTSRSGSARFGSPLRDFRRLSQTDWVLLGSK